MSPPTLQDPETGNDPNVNRQVNREHSQSTLTKLDQPPQGPQEESKFGDSSEPLFSMYTKAAQEEDNKMVESWQRDAEGILIFTGLFSAAVAALLAITVPDLRPNSQDTSAFYLGNIYGILADPNATRTSIPSPDAKPPPFSAPRYAVWVNSLWFLSLVMSVSCALWATSLNQWARRYIRLTQPARCSPEKRARMRAFYVNGVDKMHTPWAVEGLPMLLHLSLFLFFAGLVVYLFNVDQEVFTCVVSWIGFFSMVYGSITFLPLIRQDSPYNTPLSIPLWFLFASILYAAFLVLAFTGVIFALVYKLLIACWYCFYLCYDAGVASEELRKIWYIFTRVPDWWRWLHRYRGYSWVLGGLMKKAEEMAEKQSPEIDGRILGWTIGALGDDDSLEKFFEAMPGFFDSELVKDLKKHLPHDLLQNALAGFLGRTLSSKSIINAVKLRRLNIFTNTLNLIGEDSVGVSSILGTFLSRRWELAPQTIEVAHTLARWHTSKNRFTSQYARCIVARVLAVMPERDDRWVELATHISGLSERDLRDNITHGENNLLFAALIDLCRQANRSHEWMLMRAFAQLKFDIRSTLPRLQHDFCALWNEFVVQARIHGDPHSTPARILNSIRHHYVALHRDTADAAPTEILEPPVDSVDFHLLQPLEYPLCNIPSHHPDSTAHVPISTSHAAPSLTQPGDLPDALSPFGGSTASIIRRSPFPSELTIPRETTESSQQALTATPPALPAQTGRYPTHASPPDAVAALQYIPPATTLSHLLKGTAQQDIVTPFVGPDTGEIVSKASMHAPESTLALGNPSVLNVLNESSASADARATLAPSNPFLSQLVSSDIVLSTPASPAPPRNPLFLNADFLAIFSGTTPFRPTGNTTLPRLRARGLVNTGNICFANTVLQLLVRSPQFWNLFKELGYLKEQRVSRGPETGTGATPLVDATVKFFEEFTIKEPPPAQQQPQQTPGRKPREDEEAMKVDSFEPIYLYDAMKEKRQLKLLLGGQQQDAEEFFRLYLDALDEEVSQSGLTDVVNRSFATDSGESPLMRIFGGKNRSTLRAPNQPDTITTESWRSLHLDIQHDSVHTIEDALAGISHLQPVLLGPSGFSVASQQVLIEVLPPILVLHLKRFLYDAASDSIVKINKPVQFAPELEIPVEMMAPVANNSMVTVHYKLYGVLYHHGDSAGGGHYTVDVLHPNGDNGGGEAWLRIDDEVVSAVPQEDVFGGHGNEWVQDRYAYMLFYCRTAPA